MLRGKSELWPWHPTRLRAGIDLAKIAQGKPVPIRLLHLVSNTLRSGPRLQKAFERLGRALPITAVTHTATSGQDLDQFLQAAGMLEAPFVLLQVHGTEREERLLERALKLKPPGTVVVYLHRPEELILRFAVEQACDYATAKLHLAQVLCQARAVVLPGECCLSEYQDMLPKTLVTAIPLGFAPPEGEADTAASEVREGPIFVGSATTWGEMRHLEDLSHLVAALGPRTGPGTVTGYASGKFDRHCDIEAFATRGDVVPLSNSDILAAMAEGRFGSEREFRLWLSQLAGGKTILRASLDEHGQVVAESLPEQYVDPRKWESRLVDFNLQLYWEILDHRREQARRGLPKVEYSGTLHKGHHHELFVVLASPAMEDVRRDECFRMIEVPLADGLPDFPSAAERIAELIHHPDLRVRELDENRKQTRALGMNEVALGFYLLLRHLIAAPPERTAA